MNKLLSFGRKPHPDIEALSARIDGALDAVASTALQDHLAACDECRAADEELRSVRITLSAMPEVHHPRSFRLRQADVEAPRAARPQAGGSPVMRWAPACAAVSAVVFVAVLGADLATRSSDSATQFSSLDSTERIGVTAEDDAEAPAAGAVAPQPADSQAERNTDAASPPETDGEDGGMSAGAPDLAGPTGAPPDGDAATVDGPSLPAPNAGDAESAGGTNFVPPTSTPVAIGAVPPDAPAPTSRSQGDLLQFTEEDDGDGNRNGFLIVEIAAAAIALLAGTAYVARRWIGGRTA